MEPPTVATYMTPSPHAITRRTTVHEALREMHVHRIRHLLVMDAENLVGLVSERELDLLTPLSLPPERVSVEVAMTPDPFCAELDAPLADVAMRMAEAKVGSAVVTSGGVAVGIFTTVDALRALSELLRAHQ